jgi:hypothetical protein
VQHEGPIRQRHNALDLRRDAHAPEELTKVLRDGLAWDLEGQCRERLPRIKDGHGIDTIRAPSSVTLIVLVLLSAAMAAAVMAHQRYVLA